jgi:putative exporter of polyketide antibiotics
MTSQPPDSDNAGDDPAQSPAPGVPRWLKVFLLVATAIVVLGVVVMLLVGGDHGPGRHQSAPATSGQVVGTVAGWGLG